MVEPAHLNLLYVCILQDDTGNWRTDACHDGVEKGADQIVAKYENQCLNESPDKCYDLGHAAAQSELVWDLLVRLYRTISQQVVAVCDQQSLPSTSARSLRLMKLLLPMASLTTKLSARMLPRASAKEPSTVMWPKTDVTSARASQWFAKQLRRPDWFYGRKRCQGWGKSCEGHFFSQQCQGKAVVEWTHYITRV